MPKRPSGYMTSLRTRPWCAWKHRRPYAVYGSYPCPTLRRPKSAAKLGGLATPFQFLAPRLLTLAVGDYAGDIFNFEPYTAAISGKSPPIHQFHKAQQHHLSPSGGLRNTQHVPHFVFYRYLTCVLNLCVLALLSCSGLLPNSS